MTSEIELLMLIGDKTVKIYEKDKEIKELKQLMLEAQSHIEDLIKELNEMKNGRLVTSSSI